MADTFATPAADPSSGLRLSYRDVLDAYDRDKRSNPLFSDMSLPDYASKMNQATGSSMFDAGSSPSWIKNTSATLDRALESTGLPQATGGVMGALGSTMGAEQPFQRAGEALPRSLVDMAPMIVGALPPVALATGGASIPAGLAASGAMSGANAYEKTDSVGQALTAAGLTALIPGAGNLARQSVLKGLGAQITGDTFSPVLGRRITELVGDTLGQRAAAFGAEQGGIFGVNTLAQMAQGGVNGQSLIESAASQLPFLLIGGKKMLEGPSSEQRAGFMTRKFNGQVDQYVANLMSPDWHGPSPDLNAHVLDDMNQLHDIPSFDLHEPSTQPWTTPSPERPSFLPTLSGPQRVGEPSPYVPTLEDSRGTLFGKPLAAIGTQENPVEGAYVPPTQTPPVLEPLPRRLVPVSIDPDADLTSLGDESHPGLQFGKVITPPSEAQKAIVRTILAEPDNGKAIQQISDYYRTNKPDGLKDPVLEGINDQTLQNTLQYHLDRGLPLDDAVNKTTQSLKNVLEDAVTRQKEAAYSQNKIFTLDGAEAAAERMAQRRANRLKAAQEGTLQMSLNPRDYVGIDAADLPDMVYRAGAWIEMQIRNGVAWTMDHFTKQMVGEMPELGEAQQAWQKRNRGLQNPGLSPIEQLMRDGIEGVHSVDSDKQLLQRQQLIDANTAFTQRVVDPKQQARVLDIMGNVVRRAGDIPGAEHQAFLALAKVDPRLADGQLANYFQRTVDNALKMYLRESRPTIDKIGTYPTESEATQKAEAIRQVMSQRSQEESDIRVTQQGNEWKVTRVKKTLTQAEPNFRPERRGTLGEAPDLGETESAEGEQAPKAQSLLGAGDVEFREGEDTWVPTEQTIGEVQDAVTTADQAHPGAGDVLRQPLDDLLQKLQTRLNIIDLNAHFNQPGVKNPPRNLPKFAEQAKVFLDYQMDARNDLTVVDQAKMKALVNEAADKLAKTNPALAESMRLDTAADVSNMTAQMKDNLFGPNGWLSHQPEMLAFNQMRRSALDTEAASGRQGQVDPLKVPDKYMEQSVGNAWLMSARDFFSKLFFRAGDSKEVAETKAQAAERYERVMSVFPQSAQARITGLKGSSDLGVALLARLEPSWQGIVAIAQKVYPTMEANAFMHGVVGVHEGLHIVQQLESRGQLSANDTYSMELLKTLSDAMSPDQRLDMFHATLQSMMPEGALRKLINDGGLAMRLNHLFNYSSQTSSEFIPTMAGLVAQGLADHGGASRISDNLVHGDVAIQRSTQVMFRHADEVASAVKAWFHGEADPVVDKMWDAFKSLARTPDAITKSIRRLNILQQFQPEMFAHSMAANIVPDFDEAGSSWVSDAHDLAWARISNPEDRDKVPNLWERNVVGFGDNTQLHPSLQPIYDDGIRFQSMCNQRSMEKLSALYERGVDGGTTFIKKINEGWRLINDNPSMRKAVNEISDKAQLNERQPTPQEVADTYRKHGVVDPATQAKLEVHRQGLHSVMKNDGEFIKTMATEKTVNTVAAMLLKDSTISMDATTSGARQMVQAAQAGQPVVGVAGISPETFSATSQHVPDLLASLQRVHQTIDSKSDYLLSEQRFGRFQITYKQDGKSGRVSSDTEGAHNAEWKRLQNTPGVDQSTLTPHDTKSGPGTTMLNPDIANALLEHERDAFNIALRVLPEDQANAVRSQYSLGDSIDKELTARGLNKFMQPRQLSAGRETIDYTQNTVNYSTSLTYALTRQWLRERGNLAKRDPDLMAHPEVLALGQQKIDNMLAPGNNAVRKFKEGVFMYYLGVNPTSWAVNLMQPLQTLPANLVSNGMGAFDAAKLTAASYLKVAKYFANGTLGDGWLDAQMHKLDRNGLVGEGMLSQFFDGHEIGQQNLARTATGVPGVLDKAASLLKPISHLFTFSRALYGTSEGVVTRVSAVAALEHARMQGLSDEASYNYTVKMIGDADPGSMGKLSQPVGAFSGKFIPRSAANIVMTLQNYTVAMMSQFYRMGKQAIASGDLTSAQSKAFGTLVGTQFLLAGTLGLPGVGAAIGLVNQLFPQAQIHQKLREGIAGLSGDDQQTGSNIADIALRGATTLSGLDLSGRFGLSNLLGVSSYDGFNPADVLGASGNIVTNMFKAEQDAQQGRFGLAARDAAPQFLKGIIDLYRNDGAVRNTQTGALLTQASPGEKVAMAIGLQPKRIADTRLQEQLARASDEQKTISTRNFYNKLSDMLVQGDMQAVRKNLLDREKVDPDFRASDGLKAVVEMAQSKVLPEDPRRGGSRMNAMERQQLAQSFGPSGPAPSETQRLFQRQGIMAQFGLGANLAQTDVMQAAMTDALMQKNPNLNRANAKLQVARMMGQVPKQEMQLTGGMGPSGQ